MKLIPEGPTRVLVVEDEGIVARDITNILVRLGYEVAAAVFSGEEAVDAAERARPHLVLMDVVLQGEMDGITAAHHIREALDIPVIYLTAYADHGTLERAKLTQPYGYLLKPFEEVDLRFSIEMALYKHHMETELRRSREQYKSLLESAGAAPWELDLGSMAFTYMGHQVTAMLGYPPEEWTDFTFWQGCIHPHDAPWVVKTCLDAIRLGRDRETHEIEYRMLSRGGREVWVRDIVTLAREEGDRKLRGFFFDITRRKQAEMERERLIAELQDALGKIKTLRGLLPICAWCKRIRDDHGYWNQVESYVQEHSEAEFTHGMCPECEARLQGELDETLPGEG
jgi:PAS domain S-box-containing protein